MIAVLSLPAFVQHHLHFKTGWIPFRQNRIFLETNRNGHGYSCVGEIHGWVLSQTAHVGLLSYQCHRYSRSRAGNKSNGPCESVSFSFDWCNPRAHLRSILDVLGTARGTSVFTEGIELRIIILQYDIPGTYS